MSLQVWLPLNGDMTNHGLSQITYTGTPGYKTPGKISAKTYDISKKVTIVAPALANLKTFSVCFWGMTEECSSTSNWQDLIGFVDINTSGTSGTFRWETGYSAASYYGIHWHDNATSALSNTSVTHTTSHGVWTHCCVVFDYETSTIKSYTNGVLLHTGTHAGGHFNTSGTFYLGDTATVAGRIQDVRFYDHALSPKEVKEISKALAVHYPLNQPERSVNLLKNTRSLSGFGGGNLDTSDADCGFNAVKTGSCWDGPYINLKQVIADNNLKVGDIVTYSIMCKVNFNGTCKFSLFRANGTSTVGLDGKSTAQSVTMTANVWKRLRVTFALTDYSTTTTNMRFEYNSPHSYSTSGNYKLNDGSGNYYCWFALPKLELGNNPDTQWTPNPADTDSWGTTEYDCSGYGNDGTISGNIIANTDSAKYDRCYEFRGETNTARILSTTGFPIGTAPTFSINFFYKPLIGETFGQYRDVMGFYPQCRLEVTNTNGKTYNWFGGFTNSSGLTSFSMSEAIWYMVTLVSDGSKLYQYLNGKLIATRTLDDSYKSWTTDGNFYIGDSYISFGMSDFRIYATALSDTDIEELYSVSASIDASGNMYAYELKEVE